MRRGGTAVAGNPKTLTPDADPNTFTASAFSDPVTPNAPGTWCFRAVYSGNTPYTGSSDSSTGECFLVIDTSSTSSAQTWLPNDSATVVLSGGGPASGSVQFTLYQGGDCGATGGAQLYTETQPLVNGTASTTNTGTSVSTSQTVSWKTVFVPGNPALVQGSTHCEVTALTITN